MLAGNRNSQEEFDDMEIACAVYEDVAAAWYSD
jgi:hypothetical protein